MEKMNIKWNYTNKIVNDLLKINRAREIVDLLEIPVSVEEEIKKETIAKRVHYSTKIEGNSLDLNTVKKIIENTNNSHERNVLEVRNYYNALMYLNKEADTNNSITEDLIFKVHNLIIGKNLNAKATYRDGQNIVEDSLTKQIVYMPPEAKDIKALINQMIKEFDNKTSKDIPIPIKAGIIEYEFVTIHPFWDGNGRTSRLLANYILKAYGYDLKGFYVMEEFYDKNINDYYNSLQMGLHHNFYFGRKDADITEWLEYFISTMANTFEAVGNRVKEIYLNSKEEFERLVTENDMEELEILDQYDLVIDLLSTATCLPQKYSLENNKARFEEAEWAKSIDYLTSTAWVGHRNLKLFRSDIPLQEEIDQVINHIKDYITYGIKDNQEKYLIETDPDDFYQYTNENSRTIQVNNKYMDFGLPSYLDTILVKRTYRDYSTYFLQVVSNRSNKSVVIGDQKIDEATYNELLNKNEVIDEVTKTELSFIENNHLFKVSFYEDFTTLEFDRDDVLSLEELPKDVRIIEKLDGSLDKSLKNREKVLKKEKSMLI